MAVHYRKTLKQYRKRYNASVCPFCKPETLSKAIYEDKFVYIVPNLTQYDLWEFHDVTDHLLIVPKRHIKKLSELKKNERLAIMDRMADYESKGYSVYARGFGFVKRSVEHQHTHLIKVTNKRPKFSLYIRKPYLLIKK